MLGFFFPLDGKNPVAVLRTGDDLVRDGARALQEDVGTEMRVQR